jgi:hypothetical protein
MNQNWPSTLIEAVDRLMSTLAPHDLDAIRHLSEGELITLHFSLGLYVRNEFGLWQGNGELLTSCFPDVTDPYMLSIIKQDPDQASGVVVDTLWRRLQFRA